MRGEGWQDGLGLGRTASQPASPAPEGRRGEAPAAGVPRRERALPPPVRPVAAAVPGQTDRPTAPRNLRLGCFTY